LKRSPLRQKRSIDGVDDIDLRVRKMGLADHRELPAASAIVENARSVAKLQIFASKPEHPREVVMV
jgi:hypothetical protein